MLQNEKIPVLWCLEEEVVETRTCKHCWVQFDITDKDLEFYEKVSPSFPSPDSLESGLNGVKKLWNGKVKYLIPSPSLCSDCRQQRRYTFRNERKLYKRKCDFSGREIISMYSPLTPYKIYAQDIWWSDKWDGLDYGKDFDFSCSFFNQFKNLIKDTPFPSVTNTNCENSDFWTYQWYNKDCYMEIGTGSSEDCYFWTINLFCRNCVDCHYSNYCENSYFLIDCDYCKVSSYLQSCSNCSFSDYCFDSEWLENCFLCFNLKNKKYCILNQEYTKEEYREKIKEMRLDTYSGRKKVFEVFKKKKTEYPVRFSNTFNSEECSGDNIYNSKNCHYSFWVAESKNCKFFFRGEKLENSYDIYIGWIPWEFCYNSVSSYDHVSHHIGTLYSWGSQNMFYTNYCFNCHDCFWCSWLKNQSYCIFNKKYSREEYETLVPKIIKHMIKSWEWGEFYPSDFSPFCYNESVAIQEYPLSKEKALKDWFLWSDYEIPFPKVKKTIPANKLPDDIKDVPDDILNWAIECEVSKKLFKIIKEELDFYRKYNLPIPRRHPDERHKERMRQRNPRKLYKRNCDKCGVGIQTTYAPERPEKVYCEKCYNKEIY